MNKLTEPKREIAFKAYLFAKVCQLINGSSETSQYVDCLRGIPGYILVPYLPSFIFCVVKIEL